MKFEKYLRDCRDHSGLTQEELVQKLFNSSSSFESLDVQSLKILG